MRQLGLAEALDVPGVERQQLLLLEHPLVRLAANGVVLRPR
jgi:hypothetical protein